MGWEVGQGSEGADRAPHIAIDSGVAQLTGHFPVAYGRQRAGCGSGRLRRTPGGKNVLLDMRATGGEGRMPNGPQLNEE